MTRRRVELPGTIYPNDPWALLEESFAPEFLYLTETIFALTNGRVGVRGSLDEGSPSHIVGTYVNGFHETWQITHAENAYGLAQEGQTIVTVPDGTRIEIKVDGEPMLTDQIELLSHRRWLDFRDGVLERHLSWRTRDGITVAVGFRRLASYSSPDVIATEVTITTDMPARLQVTSRLVNTQAIESSPDAQFDPRLSRSFAEKVLEPRAGYVHDLRFVQTWVTARSRATLLSGMDHAPTPHPAAVRLDRSADRFGFEFEWVTDPDTPVVLTKYSLAASSDDAPGPRARSRADETLDEVRLMSFEQMASQQRKRLGDFWRESDITVDGDPETQRAIRWVMYQLFSHSACLETSIPAKGLTGHAYDGHYFWDTEIYVLPFLIYTNPEKARVVLEHRYRMLDAARRRATTLDHPGALFPWRTINGEEASAYFLAGTAQYHINADIVYAIRKYVGATNDETFLNEMGAEIVFECARFWEDLGFYFQDEFHIHGVTGPDEYTALVDNNAYTNTMARMNLRYAVEVARHMSATNPDLWAALVDRLELSDAEVTGWARAAELMRIPFDETRGITPQDDDFLSKEPWDFESVSPSKYPLLLHFHPLTIYRYQVLKQADVVLADFLLGDEFPEELKRSNFAFYDPLTTGDSSLSSPIQSIMAAELGHMEQAYEYFDTALFTDLADVNSNTTDGVHMASIGGVWMAIVFGFGGMRDYDGVLSFDPRLPEAWNAMTFGVVHRSVRIKVGLSATAISFETDHAIDVSVRGSQVRVEPSAPQAIDLV